MLIQTSYNPLPNKSACNNGAVLLGSSVSSMCAALSQLTHVKFLGMANYPIMRSTYLNFGTVPNPGVLISSSVGGISKGYTEGHKLFYASTPLSTWLCVIIAYESGTSDQEPSSNLYSPVIEIDVKALNDSGSGYTEVATADYGIRLDSANSVLLQSSEVGAGVSTYVHLVESGINIPPTAPTSTSFDAPRPLYLPLTAGGYDVRGEVVAININTEDCKIRHVTILDIYEPEVQA
jgi:hypothetical protein